MDLPTPTPPPPISGYRSRAINAAVDFAAALRPVAGPGARVADGPGGKIISLEPRGLADVPRPWTVRVVPLVGDAPSQVEWRVRVWAGLVVADGVAVEGPEPGGTDEATGLAWHDAPEGGGEEAPWLCVEIADSDSASASGSRAWRLAWRSEAAGETWRAIARLDGAGPPPRLAQLDIGVVDIGGGAGHHFGDADDAETRTEWEQSEEVPAILDLDNATRYKLLVDSRGNIISWTSGEEGEEPETPSNPHAPPPTCGNPLNDPVSDNPLDDPVGGAGGGGGNGDDDTGNPLDYEGDGGYTPACSP